MKRTACVVAVVLATFCGVQQVAGSPFSLSSDEFPLIMTGLGSRAYIPSIVTELKCDYVHIYVMSTSTNRADLDRDLAFFDDAEANGAMVMAYLRGTEWVDKPNGLEQLRTCVQEFKDHPALGFWYMFDEPDNHDVTPAVVQQYYQMVKQESPGVPVGNVHAWSLDWADYEDGQDILMYDNYPVSDEPFPDAPIDQNTDFTELTLNEGEPVIPLLQSCRCVWRGEGMRYPNRAELRYSSYACTVLGVRGLSWYTHSGARADGDETWLDGTFAPMLRNLRTFVDAVEPAHGVDKVYGGGSGSYFLGVWDRGSSGTWVVLVNDRNYARVDLTRSMGGRITNADLWPCDGTREWDDRIRDGSLQDIDLDPWETCVWQAVPLGLPATPADPQATAMGAGRIDLTWTDTADNELFFKIDRRLAGTTNWSRIGTAPADATRYRDIDEDLNPDTTYRYQVKAYNAVGNGRYSDVASATTLTGMDLRLAAGNDDAEEIISTGSTGIGSSDLDLGENDKLVGIRFPDVSIPPAALIESAYLQFTSAGTGSDPTSLTLHGQAIDDAPAFAADNSNISARDVTAESVTWDDVPGWYSVGSAGPNRRTPDLCQVIQAIVARPGWAVSNALALIVSGSGARAALSYDGDVGGAPFLHIHYSLGKPATPTNVQAAAKSAGRIDVTWADTSTNETGFKVDRRLAGVTNWSRVAYPPANVTLYRDVAGLAPDTAYEYQVKAYNGEGNGHYGNQASATTLTGIDGRPAGGDDDAEEIVATGGTQTGSLDLDLVNSGGQDQVIGIRFRGLSIPNGSVIDTAFLQFTAKGTGSVPTSLTLRGQAIDDAPAFSSSGYNISARAVTGESVAWNNVPAWTAVGECGPDQRTPDLAGIVQAIVSRPGWGGGNALVLIISGSGAREALSYNGSDGGAPFLHVQYSFPDRFTAYNDLMWAASDRTNNITRYTGWTSNNLATSGPLVDYLTGSNVAVTLSISIPGGFNTGLSSQGGDAAVGTDAHTEFSGIVDCLGNMTGSNDCTLTFAGLSTNNLYTLVVFGNRNALDYDTNGQNRTTEYVLSGVDSFVNDSTPGAEILTHSVTNDTTKYCTGYNTDSGYVARWTDIQPGDDTMTLTVMGDHHYINALKLEWWAGAFYVPPTVQFRHAAWTNAESVTAPTIEVYMSRASVYVCTLSYAASDGGATSPADYTLNAGTLMFLPGTTNLTITPSIVNDGIDEPDEAFTVLLSDPNQYCTIGSTDTHAVTIEDDDEPATAWKYRKGLGEASTPISEWRRVAFDDAAWLSGSAPLGYGAPGIVTTLADMQGQYSCLFLRRTFAAPNPALVKQIDLHADYNDGFLVWINGEEVARVNVAGTVGDAAAHTDLAASVVSATWSNTLTDAAIPFLFKGSNVLAVQAFNESVASSDLTIDVQMQLLEGSSLSGTVDADGDGMADQWESDNIPGGDGAPDADEDVDDALNLDEFVGGTDPDSTLSVFRIKAEFVNGEIRVSFPTVEAVGPNYEGQSRYYSLQEKPLQGGTFQTVPGYDAILGQGQTVVYTNASSTLDKDYRGRVWLE